MLYTIGLDIGARHGRDRSGIIAEIIEVKTGRNGLMDIQRIMRALTVRNVSGKEDNGNDHYRMVRPQGWEQNADIQRWRCVGTMAVDVWRRVYRRV